MNPFRPLLLAGVLTAGVTALAAYAYAGQDGLKTLILQLPGASVQQIQCAGATPPQIVIIAQPARGPMPVAVFAPAPLTAPQDPFAPLGRMSAAMNAQAVAMMGAMNLMLGQGMPGGMTAAWPGSRDLVPAASAPLPPGGSASYSFMSASSSGPSGACMESVQITAMGPGQTPKIVSRRAGDCGHAPFGLTPGQTSPASLAPPRPPLAPQLIRARAVMPRPDAKPSRT